MARNKEGVDPVVAEAKKLAAPLFEKAMAAALRAKNWLAMEVIARAFNETDPEVWALNAFVFIGTTEYMVEKIAQEKGLNSQEVGDLKRDLITYEAE